VVEKEAPADTILTAIRKVHGGEVWIDRAAAGRILVAFSRRGAAQPPDPEQVKIATLTDREREIVAVTAANAGATAAVIAEMLRISESTLRNHLTSIYDKLAVANRLELFAYAHKHGLTKRPG
jgi:two-component system, NarL family, nitrate/nitrite response regulator NarL